MDKIARLTYPIIFCTKAGMKKILHKINSWSFRAKAFGLIVLGVLVYVPLMNGFNAWHDEHFTLLAIGETWDGMIHRTATDMHPPLHYILLRLWMMGMDFHTILWARCFSVFCLIITALLGVFPVRRLFGEKVALWFIALLFFMPISFFLGTDMRMYALANFFTVGSALYGLAVIRDCHKSDWVKLALFSLAALYTHYYCGFSLLIIYAFVFYALLWQGRNRDILIFFVTGFIVAAAFFPWMLIVIDQYYIMRAEWYPNMTSVDNAILATLSGGRTINMPLGFFVTLFQALCWLLICQFWLTQKKNDFWKSVCLLASIFWGVVLIAYSVSIFVSPMLNFRYLFPQMTCFFLALALVMSQERVAKKLFLSLWSIAFVLNYWVVFSSVNDSFWPQFVKLTKEKLPTNSLIVVDNFEIWTAWEFYLPEYKKKLYTPTVYLDWYDGRPRRERELYSQELKKLDKKSEDIYYMTRNTVYCEHPMLWTYRIGGHLNYCFVRLTKDQALEILNPPKKVNLFQKSQENHLSKE